MNSKFCQDTTLNIYDFEDEDGNIRVEAANRAIIIPRALPETMKRMQELFSLRDELIQVGERVKKTYDPNDSDAAPMNFYRAYNKVLDKYSDRYESLLKWQLKNELIGLFVCPDCMEAFSEICYNTEQQITSIYKVEIDHNLFAREMAEREAQKKIKGMSYGIVTNSISSVLVYRGISALTYASQARDAQHTYDRIMNACSIHSAEYKELELINKNVIPLLRSVAEKSTADFLREVLEWTDISTDIEYEKMDNKHKTETLIDEANYVYGITPALQDAITKLSSIRNSKEDVDKIIAIIADCPYCPEAYFKLIQMNVFDVDVFKIAKIVNIEKTIIPELLKVLENNMSKDVIHVLEILAIYNSKSVKMTAEQCYRNRVEEVKSKYKAIIAACDGIKGMSEWAKENVDSDLNKLSSYSPEQIEKSVIAWTNENLPQGDLVHDLYELDMISYDDIEKNADSTCTVDEINHNYQVKLIQSFSEFVQEVKNKKKIYKDAYSVFTKGLKERKKKLSEKEEELKQQGIFAFSKKKEIKEEIARIEKDYEEYQKTEPVDLKNAYLNM